MAKPIYIVDGARTPFIKARGKPGPFSASDLAVAAGRALLNRQPFDRTDFDEVIMGCIMPSENEANIGRLIALRLGCGKDMPGWTVQRNCGSGMQAIDSAMKDIALGRADLVLAGGTEAMSRAPLILNEKMVNWLADWQQAKSFRDKFTVMSRLRPHYFKPIIALLRGLTDPVCELIMGQTAEVLAHQFNIIREAMDAYALRSHQRLAVAQENGYLKEIVPLFTDEGKFYDRDDGVRPDTSLKKLAQLKPIFDRKFGEVTAGNSSQVTDGASLVIVASEKAVKKYRLPVLGRIVDVEWAALAPEVMGLGPVFAATPLLQRNRLTLEDIDYWEMNEAFAATILACQKAWASEEFCKKYLGLEKAVGQLDEEKLNIDGGAIAIGHPVGTSGARIVLHLLEILKRKKAKRGIAALCIGGGQGGAMLLEREAGGKD
ncbi:acetyl-CoA C-acetyltransferase [Coxiella burnetii]|uniref:acetyl-CoA C-acetyltransferase n=1 Tax=Coxiella burnetii TaxID=777 RepID=UPI000183D120|nr:acetyl-CoA C-acetyltransferase [Coxiella burnetii]ACJ18726.1 3-ketoacyl-CoA thiolase [Coxiella burnetii CbuG_Q212]ATN67104.1 acetyl-CoA acetyltransferase [Coxiella burnetii]OYK85879.1 acetyl-CoA acetyltransferase [Coxiella burnetii]